MITWRPSTASRIRFCSRSSYIFTALRRSISIISSRRRSSCIRSFSITFFSLICASRIVTTLAYAIIWFIFFTSSSSSASFISAFERIAAASAMCSASISVGATCCFASASISAIRTLRASARASSSCRAAASACRISSSSTTSRPVTRL